jgi:uncharacterized protein YodC (DUF2158 family)
MADAFRMNDMVRLVIGGPSMTVMNPQGAFGEVWCTWTEEGGVRREAFAAASLMLIKARKLSSEREQASTAQDPGSP